MLDHLEVASERAKFTTETPRAKPHGAQKLRIIRRKAMVADTPSRSALLSAHVFGKYVDFVKEELQASNYAFRC